MMISCLPPWFPVDCIDPSCSAHGVCIHGECHCQPGWGGASCEIAKAMCPDQCSGHGTYNAETSTCACNKNWTGPDCSLGVLSLFLRSFDLCSTLQNFVQIHCLFGNVFFLYFTRPKCCELRLFWFIHEEKRGRYNISLLSLMPFILFIIYFLLLCITFLFFNEMNKIKIIHRKIKSWEGYLTGHNIM